MENLDKVLRVCGITRLSQFEVDNLFVSLSSLFDIPFDMDRWEAEYGDRECEMEVKGSLSVPGRYFMLIYETENKHCFFS